MKARGLLLLFSFHSNSNSTSAEAYSHNFKSAEFYDNDIGKRHIAWAAKKRLTLENISFKSGCGLFHDAIASHKNMKS